MPRLSVSSWSLHRTLGPRYRMDEHGRMVPEGDQTASLSLLEIPSRMADRGIRTLEICHFHFPSVEPAYLDDLRGSIDDAGARLLSVLIDGGDITHPDPEARKRETAWIRDWIAIASRSGASHVRVVAGDAEVPKGDGEALVRLSADGLRGLARFGSEQGVRVITENFRALARRPEPLLRVLDLCEGEVGLCADFGNFKCPGKYDDLAAILPRADSVHAKAQYPSAGQMDRTDFIQCLDLCRASGFDGPYSLIFDGPGSEWDSLAEMQEIVGSYV